jgi:hypothetical protein
LRTKNYIANKNKKDRFRRGVDEIFARGPAAAFNFNNIRVCTSVFKLAGAIYERTHHSIGVVYVQWEADAVVAVELVAEVALGEGGESHAGRQHPQDDKGKGGCPRRGLFPGQGLRYGDESVPSYQGEDEDGRFARESAEESC